MVKPFVFAALPKIIFRYGAIDGLPAIIKNFGNSIILVTGKRSFIDSERGSSFANKLSEEEIAFEHVQVTSEPSPELIDKIVTAIGNRSFSLVVAVGGGSVLDTGKAISAMLYKSGSVFDYLEGVGTKEHPGTKIPFIAVPTTSGTGSEATKNAVISRTGKDGFKRSLRHDNFVPDIALLDPELTLNCPAAITASSGMDCFTQLTEAFLSDKSNEYTDALAIEGLKAVKSSLIYAFKDGSDISARTGMSFAALTSGICLTNAGLGVVHGFASSVGGMYNIPHGEICGTLMALSNEANVKRLRRNQDNPSALKKYTSLGGLFLDKTNKSDEFLVDGFIDYLHNLTAELQLPGLKKAGVNIEDLEEIASLTDCKNNPVKLDRNEILDILEKRFI